MHREDILDDHELPFTTSLYISIRAGLENTQDLNVYA